MRTIDNRVKGWLAGGAGSLLVAIALVAISGGSEPSAVTARPRPVTASPQSLISPPLPTAATGPSLSPPRHPPVRENFASALTLVLQQGDEINDDRAVFEIGYRWVTVDPAAALDFVQRLPFDNTLLLVALTNEWARHDPAAAAAWGARLPEGAGRARVLPSLVATWAENDPAGATRFASDLPLGQVRNDAVVAAISGWAQSDPSAALSWAHQCLAGAQQELACTHAVFAWSRRDPVSAAQWLRSMPDSRAWDAATSALSGAIVERYPALALSLAADISDRGMRNQRIENVARRWLAADRATAEDALIHSDLPVALVSRLLQ